MKDVFGLTDKPFRSSLVRIALPTMLQQFVSAAISLLGNVMIGGLGDCALAALLQATQVTFVLMVFMFGISSTAQAFASQYWGRKDVQNIRTTLGFSMLCSQTVGWIFLFVSLLAPKAILSLYTHDPTVHAMGVEYLRIACLSYPAIGFTSVYAAVLRGTENVRLPMITSVAGLCLNGFLNYALIYGHCGFPNLGIRGAAIAAVAAECTNMCLLFVFSRILKKPTVQREFPLARFGMPFIKQFATIAVPIFLNESLWSLASATTVLFYSWLGTHMAAAMGVFATFDRLGLVAFMGVGNACCVLCGKRIGAGEEDLAQTYAVRILWISPFVGLAAGLAVNLLMPAVLAFYSITDIARAVIVHNVHFYVFFAPVMAVSYALVVGALRSGGDARFSLMLDAGLQWIVVVPCVALACFVLHVPLVWVYPFVAPGEILKLFIGVRRIKSRRWIHHLARP